jgi:hypothetical protein
MPLDFIFDYRRGFRPTVADLRRHKEDVMAAVDALADFSIDLTEISYLFGAMSVGPALTAKNAARKFATGKPFEYASFPWVLNPCHIPAFISPEQFRDIFILCCLNDLYAGASARILPQENAGVQGTAFLSICCDPLSEMFKNLHTVQSARRFLWFKQFSTY